MVRIILIIALVLIGGVTYAEQGFIPEPTGCAYGDRIPVDSEKCVPPVETPKQPVDVPTALETPKTLPSVGADGK